MADVELAPMRSFDEFIRESRFELPDFSNQQRWMNRVVNNLLYFQTNYLLSCLLAFTLATLLSPGKMLLGLVAIAIKICAGLYFVSKPKADVDTLLKKHPYAILASVAYFCFIFLAGIGRVLLLGIALPATLVLIHASLRLRGVKNKVANMAQSLGVARRTPMAILLNTCGIEPIKKNM